MSPVHKWEITVAAGGYYPDLAHNFFGNDIDLGYENDHIGMQFYAYSRHIDDLDDPEHVSQRLYSLQLLLNGALRASTGDINSMPIQFLGFSAYEDGGFHSISAQQIEEDPFSRNPRIDQVHTRYENPRQRYPSYLLYLCKRDPDLRDLLFLLGLISTCTTLEKVLTWGTLYKILDSVKHHAKSIGAAIDTFADPEQLSLFTAACNNTSILGIYARHGASENPPPKRVMTDITEASTLIAGMTARFCRSYIAAKHP
ncbi:hypothetical protein [Chromobacterium haemolyticum]|uniref:hypothetical protein n=1 Tax=Chromobacterium TaxID=535 RepID=UPI0005BA0A10|nr:hypothetical protein [Chromobacterium haemolyticum]UGA36510.1 hypothetical protein JOS77_19435 [Chromobacterium haemolyticum]